MELFSDPEFWKALSAFAWPIAVLIIAWRFKDMIQKLLGRETVAIKVAGMEISVAQAAEQSGKMVSDLQVRVAELESRLPSSQAIPAAVETKSGGSDALAPTVRSVLWIDDYPVNNAFLIDSLQQQGVEVRTALSTRAALDLLANRSFDRIITDLGRKEDGAENPFAGRDFIENLRARKDQTPVLVLASRRALEHRDMLLRAGATDVTTSTADVLKFVGSSCSGNRHNG